MIDENIRQNTLLLQELSHQVNTIQNVVYLTMVILGTILVFSLIVAAWKAWNDE